MASVAAPLYAAELAPAHLRGRFVSLYQLAITIGIFIAYAVDQALTNGDSWRVMLGVSAVPGVLLGLAMLPMRESPRWLMRQGREDDAVAATARHRSPTPTSTRGRPRRRPRWRRRPSRRRGASCSRRRCAAPLMIGVGLAVFQQITGINAIIYYADEIFDAAGFNTTQEQAAATTWAIGGVNVLATFIAVAYVDRFGRKPLLQAGLIGMAISLTVVGLCFLKLDDHERGWALDAAACARSSRSSCSSPRSRSRSARSSGR